MPEPVAASKPEPVPEPEPEPEPVAAEAAPETEPEAAPALSAGELMARVKELRAELPRASMKECKAAVEAAGGDLAAAKVALEAEKADAWAAEDAAKAENLAEGTKKLMEMRDAKAQKKFAEEEAKAAAAPEPEPVVAAAPEPAAAEGIKIDAKTVKALRD